MSRRKYVTVCKPEVDNDLEKQLKSFESQEISKVKNDEENELSASLENMENKIKAFDDENMLRIFQEEENRKAFDLEKIQKKLVEKNIALEAARTLEKKQIREKEESDKKELDKEQDRILNERVKNSNLLNTENNEIVKDIVTPKELEIDNVEAFNQKIRDTIKERNEPIKESLIPIEILSVSEVSSRTSPPVSSRRATPPANRR